MSIPRSNEMLGMIRRTAMAVAICGAMLCPAATLDAPKEITFKANIDGSTQYYVERLPQHFDPALAHDVLIALHGHGSDRKQGVSDVAEFRAAQDIAGKYGMIYISPDYRAKTSWMGPKAEADLLQIIEDLKQNQNVKHVFLTGASMGGSSALTFAALHPELIAGVCSQNGTANHLEYENFQDAIARSFGGEKSKIPLEYKNRSAEYWPEKLTMPIAIIASGKDDVVPPGSVSRLAKVLSNLKRPVQFTFREDAGHSSSYEDTAAGLEFVVDAVLKSKK